MLEPSPETKITHKSEIYSYGLVIWEMLTLQLPHCEAFESDGEYSSEDEDEVEELDPSGHFDDDDVCDSSETARVGCRPCLPLELEDVYTADSSYDDCIAVYFTCTSEDPDERPSAQQLLDAFAIGNFAELAEMACTSEDDDDVENSVVIVEEKLSKVLSVNDA